MPVWTNTASRNGWNYDAVNARLDFGYQGTRIGHLTASGMFIAAGVDVTIATGTGLILGGSQGTVSDGDGSTNLIPEVQAHGVGTAFAGGAVLAATYSTTNTLAVAPKFALLKGGAATQVATTAVANDEIIGSLIAYASDGTDFESPVAEIRAVINGTVGTGDMPGSWEFYTTSDSGETLTLAMTINTAQNILVANNNGVVIGHTSPIFGDAYELQVLGTATPDSGIAIARYSANANGPRLVLAKGRGATINATDIVQDGDQLGAIYFNGADGGDSETNSGRISAEVDGTPGANDMPTRLLFATAADGANSPTERWRIDAVGNLSSAGAVSNVTADGAVVATGGIAFTDVANAWIDDATQGTGTTTIYIGNQTINTTSDVRVKTGITPWEGNAREMLAKARLVEFNYNLPGGGPQDEGYGPNARGRYVGMLAQETIEWAPWVVNAGEGIDCGPCWRGEECDDHSPWGVEYDHLVPVLVKAVQELSAEVRELRGN